LCKKPRCSINYILGVCKAGVWWMSSGGLDAYGALSRRWSAPPPLALYGTTTILILGFTTRFLPIAYYTSSAAGLRSINPEMEEASEFSAAPPLGV